MKKKLLFVVCLLAVILFAACSVFTVVSCSSTKNVLDEWSYDIRCAGTAKDGSYIVQVTSVGKTSEIAQTNARKCAVHGILFKGVAQGGPGCTPQRAMISDPSVMTSRADFFDAFFADNGQYGRYVSQADGTFASPMRIKGGYKAVMTLVVNKDQLRKDLERAGIIRGLSTGF